MFYQDWNTYKVLQVFLDEPNKKWQLREIERKIDLSHPTVKQHIDRLMDKDLVETVEEGVFKGYKAKKSDIYRYLKMNDLLIRLRTSGLIQKIEDRCTPNCIILFGSSVEGKDDKRGDIDIFVQSKEKDIELEKFEKSIERDINLLFEPDLSNINKELKNSLANGIVLNGYLKLID